MHYCHKNKLIHRDLKLENLLLAEKNSNQIKVCDFGIAGGTTINTENLYIKFLLFILEKRDQ